MGDSDDEYDRRGRGRDKFRRERNDYQDARPVPDVGGGASGVGGGGGNRRNDWADRSDLPGAGGNAGGGMGGGSTLSGGSGWNSRSRDQNLMPRRDNYGRDGGSSYGSSGMNRGYNSGYGGARNDRYSPADRSGDMSPPSKRIRGREWDDRYPNYELGGGHHSGHYGGGGGGYPNRDEDELHQPPMMTLKQFLIDQDDNIDEETLLKKYNDYKNDFKRTQLQEFFNRHKDEEWFRVKYFPDEIEKRKEKQAATNARRLAVFMKLYEDKWFEGISLDVDQADPIVRVMDAVAIMLEGGTEFDLKAIDETAAEEAGSLPKAKDGPGSIFAVENASSSKASGVVVAPKAIDQTLGGEKVEDGQKGTDSGLEDETAKSVDGEIGAAEGGDQEMAQAKSSNLLSPKTEDNNGSSALEGGELLEEGEEAEGEEKMDAGELQEEGDSPSGSQGQQKGSPEPLKPRPLHKTCSIFFRNLAPSITKQEIEDECKKFSGFLRLAISEAQVDRKFSRRGWATYERTVHIREICWALNSVKIRGTELGPIVNRDLTRRIRSVNGISSHKTVVRADIRHAAKLIMKLDAEKGLWAEEAGAENPERVRSNGNSLIPSRNPLLRNITEYLIEEASAEEEELLGGPVDLDPMDGSSKDGGALGSSAGEGEADGEEGGLASSNGSNGVGVQDGTKLERDEALIAVLDRMLLYLRIVHSTDYYSLSEYPQEDEMPNRIGLIHGRGLFSSARVAPSEIAEYMKDVEARVAPLLAPPPVVTPEEAKKLGLKDLDEAVEVFIKENTKELGEGKWLCPLSNKKFMGPEFVRKHILNKHMERVEQVRAETNYFNNYVLDPKRPQLPEHPYSSGGGGIGSRLGQVGGGHSGGYGYGSRGGDHRGGDMHGGLSGGHYDNRGYGGGGGYRHYGNNRYGNPTGGGDNRYGNMKRSRPDSSPMYGSYNRDHQAAPPSLSASSSSSRGVPAEAMAPPPPPASTTSSGGGGRSSLGGGGGGLLASRDTLEYDVDFEEMI